MSDANLTMAELYESEGYDPEALIHPKDVDPEAITEGAVVVAYTVVSNPDPEAPATMYALEEYVVDADDVFRAGDVSEVTDGAVSYPEDSPIEYSLRWAYRADGLGKFESVGFGDAFQSWYDERDRLEPMSWDRTVGQVRAMSDDFLRIRLAE